MGSSGFDHVCAFFGFAHREVEEEANVRRRKKWVIREKGSVVVSLKGGVGEDGWRLRVEQLSCVA